MRGGTNAPSDETLEKWFYDIYRFRNQINELGNEELKKLSKYLRLEIHNIRSKLIDSLFDEEYHMSLEEKRLQFIDDVNSLGEEISTLSVQEVEMKEEVLRYGEMDFLDILEYVIEDEEIAMPMYHMFSLELFNEYDADDNYRIVLDAVNKKIKEENNIKGSHDCQEVFKSASLFCYIAMRFFYTELQIEKYETSKEAGNKIAQILTNRIKYSEKWSFKTLETHCSILYSNAVLNRKVFIWDGFDENTDFYNKFKKVFQMEADRIQYAKDCFMTFIE